MNFHCNLQYWYSLVCGVAGISQHQERTHSPSCTQHEHRVREEGGSLLWTETPPRCRRQYTLLNLQSHLQSATTINNNNYKFHLGSWKECEILTFQIVSQWIIAPAQNCVTTTRNERKKKESRTQISNQSIAELNFKPFHMNEIEAYHPESGISSSREEIRPGGWSRCRRQSDPRTP